MDLEKAVWARFWLSEHSPYSTEQRERFYKAHPEIDRDKGFMDL